MCTVTRRLVYGAVLAMLSVSSAIAQTLSISIGVRETVAGGGPVPALIFDDAGLMGGMEHVNRDGQLLTVDGTWQEFTFTPATDVLTPFAGATANGVLDGAWGSLEHIRIRNEDGITQPIRLWIDVVTNTVGGISTFDDFSIFPYPVGSETMFQEPSHSGSTVGNLLPGGPDSSAITDTEAFSGGQSVEVNFQFIDNDPTRWLRLSTFDADNRPNPAIRFLSDTGGPADISFWLRAEIVPDPDPDPGDDRPTPAGVPAVNTIGLIVLSLIMGLIGRRRSRATRAGHTQDNE